MMPAPEAPGGSPAAGSGAVLVLGVGNPHRRDDSVGRAVAARLACESWPGVIVMQTGGDSAELLDRWRAQSRVVVVDAVRSGAPPGTVHRFDAVRNPLPPELFQTSTHALGLAAAVELARVLNALPQELTVFGVEGSDFGYGEGLSPEVASAVPRVLDQVRREIVSTELHS